MNTVILISVVIFIIIILGVVFITTNKPDVPDTKKKNTDSGDDKKADVPDDKKNTNSATYTYTENSDQSGQTINMYTGKSRSECEGLCNNTDTCAGFVAKDDEKKCWLVKDFPSIVSSTGYAIAKRSSVVSKPLKYSYTENSDQSGQSIQSYPWKTRSECEDLCDTTPACTGIVSASIGDRSCWTVYGFPSVESKDGFAIGRKP